MRELGIVDNAGVLCLEGKIAWVGPMSEWTSRANRMLPPRAQGIEEFDAAGMVVVPGFVDSHTHMMFAGDRAHEFALRSAGATYQDIARQGGGILNTVLHVRSASKKELKRSTLRYMNEMMKQGTTTVEIKTGYGLTLDAEIKMMEAIHELKEEEMMGVVATFIGAHAVPPEFTEDRAAYAELVIGQMIPYIGKRNLAQFCDVFCEQGYFDLDSSRRILEAGKAWGMMPKVHAEELTSLGGAKLAAQVGAASADHLERVDDAGIAAMRDAGVVATLLPGVSFFLNHGYAPARALIDAGVPVAIASDFNPGSCMSFSMPLMMTIACTQMRMSPEEALCAATLNGAAALRLSATCGSIEVGKNADLLVADVPDYTHLAYHFGMNHLVKTIKNGTILEF
ncbi:MAG: imidazolonepropionase [Bacteroidetes bacterium]|nr:imidazolonepropionase [Bacteroidota bacterium]